MIFFPFTVTKYLEKQLREGVYCSPGFKVQSIMGRECVESRQQDLEAPGHITLHSEEISEGWYSTLSIPPT